MAVALVLSQLRGQIGSPGHASAPSLGLLYLTDHFADQAGLILDHLAAALPEVTDWIGTVGVGVCATQVEYFDEPALAVLLCDLSPDQYRVFSGVAPLGARGGGFSAHTALVHADPETPDLAELIAETAQRTTSGHVFGGLASSRGPMVQFAQASQGHLRGQGAVPGVFSGGLSGVAFGADVTIISRVTQGALPIAPPMTVTASEANLVLALDGQPALAVLRERLALPDALDPAALERLRRTLVGLTAPGAPPDRPLTRAAALRDPFGPDVLVRHLVGLDPVRQGFAIADHAPVGSTLAFCERHARAARADLMRVCAEIRESLEPPDAGPADAPDRRMVGAVYVSCAGRGGPHFGAPSAELQAVRQALGDVPLVGFFASGEIAHHRLYGYTGVLTVFVADA